jgi:hypothetical protein
MSSPSRRDETPTLIAWIVIVLLVAAGARILFTSDLFAHLVRGIQ